MTENEDSLSTKDTLEMDPKKMKLETSMNNAEHSLEILVDDGDNEIPSHNSETESKQVTFESAVPKNGVLKDQVPCNISKRKQKQMLKQLRWEKWKPLKRAIEKSKSKVKRQEARLNNIDLGPSRKALKRSTMANSTCKLRVVLDFSYDHLMNERGLRKACKQLARCYSLNRRAKNPLQFYVTNFTGKTKEDMQRNEGYINWDVHFHEESYLDLFKKEEIVYLSSDSENIITELDDSKVYIIGGLVDHNAYKNESLVKAKHQGIQHGQLPLRKFVEMKSRNILTIDHVFDILLHVSEGTSWKDAFLKVLPARKNVQPKSEADTSEA